jgi:heme/copper-type cytochrome/quinol oxidase subunit 3
VCYKHCDESLLFIYGIAIYNMLVVIKIENPIEPLVYRNSSMILILTLLLAFEFTYLQLLNIWKLPFIYWWYIWSVFYMLTGFHGFHVIIGPFFYLLHLFVYYWIIFYQLIMSDWISNLVLTFWDVVWCFYLFLFIVEGWFW